MFFFVRIPILDVIVLNISLNLMLAHDLVELRHTNANILVRMIDKIQGLVWISNQFIYCVDFELLKVKYDPQSVNDPKSVDAMRI